MRNEKLKSLLFCKTGQEMQKVLITHYTLIN